MATKKDTTAQKQTPAPAANEAPQPEPHSEKTNTLAIIALVVSIILFFGLPIVGLILAIVAISQIKKKGEQGKGLAIGAIVISVIGIILNIIVGILLFGSILLIDKTAKDNGLDVKNGSVNLNKDGNSVSIGNATVPAGFPSDVPIYPGSKVILSSKTKDGNYSVSLTTTDSKSKVDSYYQTELSKNGWSASDGGEINSETFSGTSLTKGSQKLGLITTTETSKNQTLITITVDNQ
jgi:uncharacterized membrane protein